MNVEFYYGGLSGFRKKIPEEYMSVVDLAILDDAERRKYKVDIKGHEVYEEEEMMHLDSVVAFSDDYASLSESTIESFTNFIFRFDIGNLYLQNPPDSIVKHLGELASVNNHTSRHKYKKINMTSLIKIKREFSDAVIGQEEAQKRILAVLYNVAKGRYNKPCVMLFYGSTGVGKTESAKFIADTLKEKLFRKQFSMLHSEEFSSYIFGGKHNQNSLAKDLLERESNVILFDEFDKPHPVFHSAFYQLFDEGVYADRNFTAKMKDSIIICTSNYMTENEIKEKLGEPIYSRFDAVIKFETLSKESITKIMEKEFIRQYNELDRMEKEIVNSYQVKDWIFLQVSKLDNARQVKKIIREAISGVLVKELLE